MKFKIYVIIILGYLNILYSSQEIKKDSLYTFTTKRCTIRPANDKDFTNIHDLFLDPKIGAYIWGMYLNEEEIKQTDTFENRTKLKNALAFGLQDPSFNLIWIIEDTKDSNFMGIIHIERVNETDIACYGLDVSKKYIKLGVSIKPEYQNKKHGQEIAQEAIKKFHGSNLFDYNSLFIRINKNNVNAIEALTHISTNLNVKINFVGDFYIPNGLYDIANKPCDVLVYVIDKEEINKLF